MVGWHHQLDGHEFEQALGGGDGQGNLACCSAWGHKESDTTEWLNWIPKNQLDAQARNQAIVLGSSLPPPPQPVPYHIQPVLPPAEADFPFLLTTPSQLSAGPWKHPVDPHWPLYFLVSVFHIAAREGLLVFIADGAISVMNILQVPCVGCRLELCGRANKILCGLSPSITHACIPLPANIMFQLLWILCIFLEHSHALHCLGLWPVGSFCLQNPCLLYLLGNLLPNTSSLSREVTMFWLYSAQAHTKPVLRASCHLCCTLELLLSDTSSRKDLLSSCHALVSWQLQL